jgi:phage baseplate assembly protein W
VGAYGETLDIKSPFFARLSDDQAILSQAILMRLSTRKGTYWADPGYGINVSEYLLADLTPDAIARIPYEIQAELEKDERIAAVKVSASITKTTAGGVKLYVDLKVTPSTAQTFSMTLSVTDLTVELLTRGSA